MAALTGKTQKFPRAMSENLRILASPENRKKRIKNIVRKNIKNNCKKNIVNQLTSFVKYNFSNLTSF